MKRIADVQKQLISASDVLLVARLKRGDLVSISVSGCSKSLTRVNVDPDAFLRLLKTLAVDVRKVHVEHENDFVYANFESKGFLWATCAWSKSNFNRAAWETLSNGVGALLETQQAKLVDRRNLARLPAPEVIDVLP
ncbi:hypothetical protein VN12_20655 [Pirellula sp. SH-Sr6A]|uniref:hypothetical protein n=1 Tax=Pirellula sp. SH-Sr6A TaxID=1632865 RepID=UPI00078D3350|nr:hypothetical protein [Pirellula sp. SH-Sr6A]AMV34547.1 hypothetical protein VN12_20655 [Pirellula sp. SH-Sr6A]